MASKAEIIAQVDSMRKELKRLKKLLKALPEEAISSEKPKKTASRAKKDPSAPKKPMTSWRAWTVHVGETYPEQRAEFAAADDENKKGLAPKFASYLKESLPEEYAEFIADFKAKNPSAAKKPAAAAKKPAAKPVIVAAPAASSVASSDSSDDEEEVAAEEDAGNQWVWKGKTYFRTEDNECWYEDSGKMTWAGVYDPISDSMDTEAEEPEVEFD